jgi:hypothetical protein
VPVLDVVLDAAHRHDGAVREHDCRGQPAEPRRDPAAVLLREGARLLEAAARRDGEHDLARRGLDAQGVTPRLRVAAHAHRIDRAIERDLDRLRLGRTAEEQRAQHEGQPRDVARESMLIRAQAWL